MVSKILERKKSTIKNRAKENNLDYYISADNYAFGHSYKNENSDTRKHEFLKKNLKPSVVIPKKIGENAETPDNFGYIKTRFGFISIGTKNYKKNSPVAFSIVPKGAEISQGVSEREIISPNYYFGNSGKKNQKNFLASEISFKYNPKETEIQKLKDDKDGIPDTEKELLYPDDKEEYLIKNLEKKKNVKNENKKSISKQIEKTRDIKEEKKEDNEEFLKVLSEFLKKMKRGELKKIVESDEANARRRRILELSSEFDFLSMGVEELRRRLQEILDKEEYQTYIPEKCKSLKLENLDKNKLIEILENVLIQIPENDNLA